MRRRLQVFAIEGVVVFDCLLLWGRPGVVAAIGRWLLLSIVVVVDTLVAVGDGNLTI